MMPAHILVTGGAGGIGSALCRLLAHNGYRPIVGFHGKREQAESLAHECGGFAVQFEFLDQASIARALEQIAAQLGSDGMLHGVVLAASPPPELLPFGKLEPEMLLRQFQVNVVGPQMLLAGLIKAHFRKNKTGVVVGILSDAIGDGDRLPAPGMGAYVIGKIALRGMLQACAAEYPWLRIRTVSPSFTRTPMLDVFDPRYLEQVEAQRPIASPEQVARQILDQINS